MFFGRHIRAFNTDVSRRAPGRHVARGCVALGLSAIALATLGLDARAAGVLSLRFPSQTVVADGINATPALVMVQVVNTGTALSVNSFAAEFSTTASGTLDPAALTLASGSVASPGVFVTSAPQNAVFQTYSGTGFGVESSGSLTTLGTGTTNVVGLTFTVPAGIQAGTYTISFPSNLTLPAFTSFSNNDTLFNYNDGNNGTTFGVITVIPEPSTGTALGTATLLMAGVGFVQQRMRRKSRTVELVG